jgi:hypothetical protein
VVEFFRGEWVFSGLLKVVGGLLKRLPSVAVEVEAVSLITSISWVTSLSPLFTLLLLVGDMSMLRY